MSVARDPWQRSAVLGEIARRARRQEDRRELIVEYYRIRHRLAYPLPLAEHPRHLPQGIPGSRDYPWMVWLTWELEERWRVLDLAWRVLLDKRARTLLDTEMHALAAWGDYLGDDNRVHLATGHLAACMDLYLRPREDTRTREGRWASPAHGRVASAASELIDRDVWPYCRDRWPGSRMLQASDLHNIPFIVLVRAAQLARTVDHPRRTALAETAWRLVHALAEQRAAPLPHTEGPAYDGYLMDSVTDWLAGEPDLRDLMRRHASSWLGLVRDWTHLALPGRPDLLAPIGDVEPEMCFHLPALMRLSEWLAIADRNAPMTMCPLERLPAAALELALLHTSQEVPIEGSPTGERPPLQPAVATPSPGRQRVDVAEAPEAGVFASETAVAHPSSLTLRTGWATDDTLVAIGFTRADDGHLHADGGHVTIGWAGRFWITDPGYQQYRSGIEREWTLGAEAHNAPVIDGRIQTYRRPRRLDVGPPDRRAGPPGRRHAALDLTACYEGLPTGTLVRRDVWLQPTAAGPLVVVADALPEGTRSVTHWHASGVVAWAFRTGWARLSDAARGVWIGYTPGPVEPEGLHRHEGSRGPLTLTHSRVANGARPGWWVFWGDPSCGWTAPGLRLEGAALRVCLPGSGEAYVFEFTPTP